MTNARSLLAIVAMLASSAAFALESAEARAQTAAAPADSCAAHSDGIPSSDASSAKPVRQTGDWAWLCRYREENRLLHGQDAPQVVFIGDSITEHWPTSGLENFDKGWVGRGIGGQASSQILLRFHQDAIALKPKVIHLLAGGNDVARNAGAWDPVAFQNNIKAMVDQACAHNIALVLGTILPAKQFYWRKEIEPVDEIRSLNRWIAQFAASHRIRLVDYYTPMATPEGAMRADLTEDGVHPNRHGYQVMRRAMDSALAEALNDRRSPQRSACRSH